MASKIQPSQISLLSAINVVSYPRTNLFPSKNLRTCTFRNPKVSASLNDSNSDSSLSKSSNSSERISQDEPAITDPVKLAFAKAKLYKKSVQLDSVQKQEQGKKSELESDEIGIGKNDSFSDGINTVTEEVPVSVKQAMQRASEYKKNKGFTGKSKDFGENDKDSGLEQAKSGKSGDEFVERRNSKKEEPTISNIDFVGLDFSDKKSKRGLPAGLLPVADPFPEGDFPEVEFIVGDTSKIGRTTPLNPEPTMQEDLDLYKPKVSTWGVFPRPSNISKTFGGGRVIRPGEALETTEDKAAKEACTRKLLAAYKNKVGLIIDAKLKSESEKALRDGDYLMDIGKLKDALPYYDKVMKALPFQTELHGLAALQWSICQDSLSRSEEARVIYEKLQSHPNIQVSKKARQFMFGFQAMEMMKVKSFSPNKTGYQNYFEAFVDRKINYPLGVGEEKAEEGALNQALPYIIMFLSSPIFLVIFIAARKYM